MDLSMVRAEVPVQLVALGPRLPMLRPEQVLFFANDNVEPFERQVIEELGIAEVRLASEVLALETRNVDQHLFRRDQAGKRAVAINVTVTEQEAQGFLSVFPSDLAFGVSVFHSNLNFPAGEFATDNDRADDGPAVGGGRVERPHVGAQQVGAVAAQVVGALALLVPDECADPEATAAAFTADGELLGLR